jgi:2,4-dienoyl-CoA reductase-like NADH-dependent reductase (Old Yellow Enzyme family)
VQLTHSGRYSRPGSKPSPIIAARNPLLDAKLPAEFRVITDEELIALEEKYVEAAVIAAEIGFDAVDIKCCHGYLLAELLSAYDRPGIYGGSFENRTRFLCNVINKIKAKLGETIEIAVRMNAYDAYAHGWAVDSMEPAKADLTETKKLVRLLYDNGVKLINVSAGNPYYNPHIGRPYDIGGYIPPYNQLEAVENLLSLSKELQAEMPDAIIVATGFSWLRQFGTDIAAGGVAEGWFKIAGFGRQAFAYPSFAQDILEKGAMDQSKVCVACSKCSLMMRDGGRAGCVIRDAALYVPMYREGREGKAAFESNRIAEHV